ncbi:hypothetical protein [Flavobacterium sp. TBRC 19031]|uniref:hypothetical protein n=1 Tax=Flavobacterium mekongense TaxID=3379707 RepID=UPI003999E254
MNLVHFEIKKSENLNSFINAWSMLYSYANESVYKEAISKTIFNEEDVTSLFVWKNGMRLSNKKKNSLNKNILSKLSVINTFKNSEHFNLEIFKEEFKDLSAVWKIFLLHIIKPDTYPIYDQHIHRTYLYIHKKDYSNLSNTSVNNKEKERFYFEEYLQFIRSSGIKDIKKLDEAFFAFGQFLNTKNYKTLFT